MSVDILDRNAQTLTGGPTGPGGPLSPYRHGNRSRLVSATTVQQ